MGLHPFGAFPDKDLATLALGSVTGALKDAGVEWRDIPVAYFGHVYYQGMSIGESALGKLGLTGIPIINVENACSSGSTAFWQHTGGITTGMYDLALAFGAEKVPSGPVTVTAEDSPERYIGGGPHDGRLRSPHAPLHGRNRSAGHGPCPGGRQGAPETPR